MSSNLINSSKAKVPGSNPGESTWKAVVLVLLVFCQNAVTSISREQIIWIGQNMKTNLYCGWVKRIYKSRLSHKQEIPVCSTPVIRNCQTTHETNIIGCSTSSESNVRTNVMITWRSMKWYITKRLKKLVDENTMQSSPLHLSKNILLGWLLNIFLKWKAKYWEIEYMRVRTLE